VFSSQNSPRPAISPRTTGQLPATLNPTLSTTQWLDAAGKVLRFYAFFKEAVLDNQTETYRVRKVCILFYLSDGTMEITEMKVVNSGIGGGGKLGQDKRRRGRRGRKSGGRKGGRELLEERQEARDRSANSPHPRLDRTQRSLPETLPCPK
jgi:hypothetical protein